MNLIKFLWSASETSTLLIITLSVVNGIAGGVLLILIPDAALNIFSTDRLWVYALSLVTAAALFIGSRHLSQQKTEALTEKALENLVLRITNTVRHSELKEFEKYRESEILLGIGNAQAISSAATRKIESLQAYATLFIGWMYIFFFLSHLFGLFVLLTRFILLIIDEMFGKIIKSYAHQHMEEENMLFNSFRNYLYGFKELKFSQSKDNDIFDNHLMPRIEKSKNIRIKSSRYGYELMLINILFNLLLMVCCTSFPISSAPDVTIRVIIILLFTMQNDILINTSRQNIEQGNAALEYLRQLLNNKSLKKSDEDLSIPSQKSVNEFHSISIENIRFCYHASNDFQNFSIHIENLNLKSGEILFITGGNGSGKSTFMNVLTGLYPPDSGKIKIDNRPVSMKSYTHIFSAVFSDFHLFDRFYGMENVDESLVNSLLKLTELEDKTIFEKNRFSTCDLSTGQKKRLALVMAMVEDKPVFIFDEWAADQDPHFRRYFYESILPSLKEKGKIVIAITHDDRYFHTADKVIHMQDGKKTDQWCPKKVKQVHPIFSTGPKSLPHKKEIPLSFDTHTEEEFEKKAYSTKDFLNQINKITKNDRSSLIKMAVLLFMFSNSFVGLTIILVKMPQLETIKGTWYISFTSLLVIMSISFTFLQKIFYRTVENRIADLRISVMDHVRKTDLMTLKKVGEGRIYTALTSDIKAVADTSDSILFCIRGALRTSMIYMYIAVLYLPAFILMLILTCIGFNLYFLNHIKMIKLFEKVRDQEKKLFDSVSHLLKGFKELKLSREKSNDFFHKSIRHNVSGLKKLKLKSVQYYINNSTITYGFWKGILLMLILVMPFFGFPQEILPVAVGLLLTMPLRQVIDRYSKFHMAYLSIKRLFKFEKSMKNLKEDSVKPETAEIFENMKYENISFTYRTKDSRPFSIGPMDICFKPGEIIFITGGNGSGKSTLLNVITGLYPVDSGKIFVNNNEIKYIQAYRELFSPIFTDFHLFDRLYGMDKVDEIKLEKLLKLFQLEKKVEYSNGKFTGLELSTGQKKRLAMVITMMEDKPIYIFDEWAADQEPDFREYFYYTLLSKFKSQGKTIIAVTHDDRYFHLADRVLNLEYGQIELAKEQSM